MIVIDTAELKAYNNPAPQTVEPRTLTPLPVSQRAKLSLPSLESVKTLSIFVAIGLALATAACRNGAAGAADGSSKVAAEYDKATGRLQKLSYDANGNGLPDTWAYMDGSHLIRLEADENENGRIDRWEYYPAGAESPRTPPERIERSTNDSGTVTRKEFFSGAEMVRVEEDTDGNGVTDKWETYNNGALATLALDENADGKPDRRLLYKPDGSLEYIEVDPNGSGQFRRLVP